jgi:Na+-driven multidrug efflux pump
MRLYEAMGRGWRVDRAWFRRILTIGAPAGVQVVMRNVGMMVYFGILNLLARPTESVAAFTIGFRIESIAFLPVFALNVATATIVGQSLGAGRADDAEAAVWRIVGVGAGVLAACGLFFWVMADVLAAAFTTDPVVRGLAASYLRVMAVSEPFLALVMVLNGALQGAGDARAPMVAVFCFQILFRVPLAYVLAVPLGFGAVGAWWALTASMIAQGAGIAWYFRLGTWRTREI